MHWPHCGQILVNHGLCGSAALTYVAPQAADEPKVRLGVHEDFDVKEIAERRILKNQDAFDNKSGPRLQMHSCGNAPVLCEIVNRTLDRPALAQFTNMADQERRIHRIGMVEILLGALLNRKMREILVIMILLKQKNAVLGKHLHQAARDGGLAGAGSTAYSDCQATRHVSW